MKYSIIIPIYNAEKTLNRCLDSVLKDSHNAEIILINDGSKDQSGKICEEYKSKNLNVVYIYKQNKGVSAARNDGLNIARGKYVLFVDSDDYVVENFYELLDSVTENDDVDAVCFSLTIIRKNRIINKTLKDWHGDDPISISKKLSEGICKKWINSPCAKLYKKEIIDEHNLRFFESISIGEDRLLNINYALYIRNLRICSQPAYIVTVENQNSLSRKPREDILIQSRLVRQELDKTLENLDVNQKKNVILAKAITEALDFGRVRSIYGEAKRLRKRGLPLVERLKILDTLCKKINSQKYSIPKKLYCYFIAFPVRVRLSFAIDLLAKFLNK